MFLIELLDKIHIDDTVTHIVVVTVLSGTVVAVTDTIAAIEVADVGYALLLMYSPPVSLRVVAIGTGRVVFLHRRLKVVLTRAGCQ